MAYRYDPDLEFLSDCSSEELDQLVYLLTHDKDGKKRFTEELTHNNDYKRYYPQHSKYWEDIAAEIQRFGGNTFINLFRGSRGVPYKELLCDVCDKMKVNYNKYSSVQQIEENLLMKVLTDAFEEMSLEERQKLLKELGISENKPTTQILTTTFIAMFRAGGFKSYKLTLIIVNAVLKALIGRGLSLGGNALLVRTASILTGPIGWTITALWTAADIAGPAYRVTIPAVFEIAYLRKLNQNRELIAKAEQENEV
ncbi:MULTISPECIES: DUF3944 domain-containing protein [unclassified Avibacterium]|uniref:DUF3944 domain-containing protein n=1 Tax=unclassified Avibacterium TaxID=2685287 RepID=UPI0020264A12|nr:MULTISPECIES: DUF3944 domain-containing protein [unclassified Avibacterium]MCW9699013.1 DUF3944 domain-containing protein [Avibacterium sp. 20-129]URL06789.1 DUF3944 domain-containing protein [Avibacterium sp. 21-595]